MIMFIFLTTVDLKTDSFNSSVLGQNRFRLSCRVGILGIKRIVFREKTKIGQTPSKHDREMVDI